MASAKQLKKVFTVEVEGKKVELAVKRPDPKVEQKGQQVHNRTFREAVDSGAILRAKVDRVVKSQGLWDEARAMEYVQIQKRLTDGEKKLARGGIKLSEAKEVAVQMRRDRNRLRDLAAERNVIDQHTAEAQAENARFNYYVSVCTVVNDNGAPFFKDLDDYLARSAEPAAITAAQELAQLLYGLAGDFEAKLPENRFLVKYRFAREGDLHLINKEGHTIDAAGRLVDEQGRFIAYVEGPEGEQVKVFVDGEGNRVDEDGDYVEEFSEFIDDTEVVAAAA
jgi:hypothetical protein